MSGQWWESNPIVGPFSNITEANAWAAANPSSLFLGLLAIINGVPYSWSGSAWVAVVANNYWAPTQISTPNLDAAMSAFALGSGDVRILLNGDSTIEGVGGSNLPGVYGTDKPTLDSPSQYMAQILNDMGINARDGLAIPPNANNANCDARWAASGFARSPLGMASYACYESSAAGASLVFDPSSPYYCDAFDVYILTAGSSNNPGNGTLTATGGTSVAFNSLAVTGDYGAPGAVNSVGVYLRKIRVAAGTRANTNTLAISVIAGKVWVVGVEPIDTTQKTVYIGNAGIGTTTTQQWKKEQLPSFPYASTKGLIEAYAPNAIITSLGINDANNGVAQSDYIANMAAYSALLPSSAVDKIWLHPFASPLASSLLRKRMQLQVIGLANAGYTLAGIETPNAAEWWSYSVIHPIASGYKRIAKSIIRTILDVVITPIA